MDEFLLAKDWSSLSDGETAVNPEVSVTDWDHLIAKVCRPSQHRNPAVPAEPVGSTVDN